MQREPVEAILYTESEDVGIIGARMDRFGFTDSFEERSVNSFTSVEIDAAGGKRGGGL